jgi:hypothetical protein
LGSPMCRNTFGRAAAGVRDIGTPRDSPVIVLGARVDQARGEERATDGNGAQTAP